MSKKVRPIPQFRTEAEERTYRESHDSADHVDWSKAERVRLPNLKPATISSSSGASLSRSREKASRGTRDG